MARKTERKWMRDTKNPKTEGKFSRKAKRAHMSTQAYARKERHASGALGKEARLALTYAKYRPKKRIHKREARRSSSRG